MKKIYCLGLIFVLLTSLLVGCTDSAVSQADSLISQIGEVSLESKDSIQLAEDAVSKLSSEQQSQLTNMKLLTEAQAKYDTLLKESYQNEANSIIEQIDKIGDIESITHNSASVIESAQSKFDAAEPDVQKLVTNASKLSQANSKLEKIKKDAWKPCRSCGGSGKQTCISCHGSGRVKYYATDYGEVEGIDYEWGPCTMCDEKGKYTCESCNGSGGYYDYND